MEKRSEESTLMPETPSLRWTSQMTEPTSGGFPMMEPTSGGLPDDGTNIRRVPNDGVNIRRIPR